MRWSVTCTALVVPVDSVLSAPPIDINAPHHGRSRNSKDNGSVHRSSSSHGFTHVLEERLNSDGAEDTSRSGSAQSKDRKAANHPEDARLASANPQAAPQTSKLPITGYLGLVQVLPGNQQGALASEPALPAVGSSGLASTPLQGSKSRSPVEDTFQSDSRTSDLSSLNPLNASPLITGLAAAQSGDTAAVATKLSGTSTEQLKVLSDALPASSDIAPAPAAAMPGHLAFALRLNANASGGSWNPEAFSVKSSAPGVSPASQAAASPAIVATAPAHGLNVTAAGQPSDAEKQEDRSHSRAEGTSLAAASGTVASSTQSNDAASPEIEAPVAVPAPEVEDHLDSSSSDPVRNVHMQVVGADNKRVDIRLMDQSGELRVSVKTPDLQLTQNLQAKIPELTSRLEAERFHTEVWMPSLSQTSSSAPGEREDPGWQQPSHGQQQHQPDWVDVLEASTT